MRFVYCLVFFLGNPKKIIAQLLLCANTATNMVNLRRRPAASNAPRDGDAELFNVVVPSTKIDSIPFEHFDDGETETHLCLFNLPVLPPLADLEKGTVLVQPRGCGLNGLSRNGCVFFLRWYLMWTVGKGDKAVFVTAFPHTRFGYSSPYADDELASHAHLAVCVATLSHALRDQLNIDPEMVHVRPAEPHEAPSNVFF